MSADPFGAGSRDVGARGGAVIAGQLAIPERRDGYAPIRDYAVIGDGRTVALVARDGAIDWLCLPDIDSPPVFGALLDAERGGHFVVAPEAAFSSERRYLANSNILETTFRTGEGTVRVTDAMTLPIGGLFPLRELVRVVEGISGRVPVVWSVDARFDFGRGKTRLRCHDDVGVVDAGADALAIQSWEAGTPSIRDGTIGARFDTYPGSRATLAVSASHQEPLVVSARADVEARLAHTGATWRAWTESRTYAGPWRDAVHRSGLALKLLVHAPSGAIAAAATTSLPEQLGGDRNWDYRFCWVRDSAFVMNALLQLGCAPEADAFFWWLMHASQLSRPRLQVLYRLDGGTAAREDTIESFAGYRGSRPVRVGNDAVDQLQLDIYGDVMHTAWLYANSGRRIDRDLARRLAKIATFVTRIWHRPDAGLWEVRGGAQHFTQSKMMCWVALDRAIRLADRGDIPSKHTARWRTARRAVADFIDDRCWSTARNSYTRFAGSDDVDAGLLLGVLFAYGDPHDPRLVATVEAIQGDLTDRGLVRRYTGEDGLGGTEGCFLACSFWLVEALALLGRSDTAVGLMEQILQYANDVGLYAEEIDPNRRDFLGNFPQGLTHLALIGAAAALQGASIP
jgi:GH15 family glucan-1,4-alpha-glucosidase